MRRRTWVCVGVVVLVPLLGVLDWEFSLGPITAHAVSVCEANYTPWKYDQNPPSAHEFCTSAKRSGRLTLSGGIKSH